MQRRWLVGALPALFAATRVLAQDAASAAAPGRRYVAMSLVSDKLSMVEKTGGVSDPTQNHPRTTEVPLAGAPYETAALRAMASGLAAADPAARTSFLAGSAPEFYADQDDWFDGDAVRLPEKLRQAVGGESADRLLLLTKWRGDAVISDGKTSVGSGKIAGLGFYRYARREGLSRDDTDVHVYVAPFVYTRLSLVDLATSRLVRSQVVHDARPYPATITTAQQFDALLQMIDASTAAAVARALGA
ncbi:hypothetical protein [Scleromatobacter humisilvae]|uniref:Uncharacterized protein n=1 Tax=Scleromatobacter humisilvae TaxID=2897159 RepID=A0A9X1YMB4_9BURK|nr:hypothetical protein [Scleromatobacter humisilvae]MCK9688763.1 hypothetical protein [Scleromatobacter humisilvae]